MFLPSRRRILAGVAAVVALCSAGSARADDSTPAPAPAPVIVSQTPHLEAGQHFTIDPVADGVLVAGGAGFAGLLSLVLQTGEIQATAPGPVSNLLSIDRSAVTQTIDPHASLYSDIGLYTTVAFAVADPIFSGVRDGWDAALVDAVMYAETVALTETITDITKIAVRRPRPVDYVTCPPASGSSATVAPSCTGTNFDLSFFSGHAATVAAIGATATYLAFVRAPRTPRPWITLAASVLMTSFVSYERVRAGDHFPTDVIAGSMAGAAIGVLVPHLHRHKDEPPPVLLGAAPAPGGGMLSVTGTF
jgi:membrane-associated phospholipid phosphatase